MDTRETLKALVELAKKATPGPWKLSRISGDLVIEAEEELFPLVDDPNNSNMGDAEADMPFIVAARNAIPALEALLAEPATVPVSELEALAKQWEELSDMRSRSETCDLDDCADDLRSLINRSHK